jgi:inner membrane protein
VRALQTRRFCLDNITHTLIGVLVGETAARAVPSPGSGALHAEARRNLFVTVMALGSNVPDLDFIPSRIADSKLDYLLHHRGHTHTILGALAIAGLLYLACEAWCRWRRQPLSTHDRAQLIGIACVGTLLHIGLDYTNSYGVHPFWPFDNRWFFGDAVFIVEPLFWAASAPLVFLLRSIIAKAFVGLALTAGVALSFATGMVPLPLSFGLLALTIAMLVVGKSTPPRVALITGLGVWAAVNVTFMRTSALARNEAESAAAQLFPNLELLDAVLTPMPVNPFCWDLIFVQADARVLYVRRASLALMPHWIAAWQCPSRSEPNQTTAPMAKIDARDTATVAWIGEIKTSRAALSEWIATDCDAAAFMRFARAPWLVQVKSAWILGDARYDRERELSFAEIELSTTRSSCMADVPPWIAPRAEL